MMLIEDPAGPFTRPLGLLCAGVTGTWILRPQAEGFPRAREKEAELGWYGRSVPTTSDKPVFCYLYRIDFLKSQISNACWDSHCTQRPGPIDIAQMSVFSG